MATNPPKGDGHRNGAVRQDSVLRHATLKPKHGQSVMLTREDSWTVKKMVHHLRVSARENNSAESEANFRPAIPAL